MGCIDCYKPSRWEQFHKHHTAGKFKTAGWGKNKLLGRQSIKLPHSYHLGGKIKLVPPHTTHKNKFRNIKALNIKKKHSRKIQDNIFMALEEKTK